MINRGLFPLGNKYLVGVYVLNGRTLQNIQACTKVRPEWTKCQLISFSTQSTCLYCADQYRFRSRMFIFPVIKSLCFESAFHA